MWDSDKEFTDVLQHTESIVVFSPSFCSPPKTSEIAKSLKFMFEFHVGSAFFTSFQACSFLIEW